jgi:hypothetical protein
MSSKYNIVKRFFLLLVFIFISIIEVRVRAFPKANVDSYLLARKNIVQVSSSFYQIRAHYGAALVYSKDKNNISLVRGLIQVEAKAETQIHMLYGDLIFSDGEVLIEASDSGSVFTNLSSTTLNYMPRGEKSDQYELPMGFSNYFSRITPSGVAETGIPKPIELEKLVIKWSQLFARKERNVFTDKIKKFKPYWLKATEVVGPWYTESFERKLAEQEAEEERVRRIKAKIAAENKKFQDMFRSRINNEN